MSNQVNDQIADRVIDEVSAFMFNALESVSNSIEADEEIARDLLIEIKFNQEMERPGPHG